VRNPKLNFRDASILHCRACPRQESNPQGSIAQLNAPTGTAQTLE
jgi:hypothetical protein